MNIIWLIILISGTAVMLLTNPDGALKAMLTGSKNSVDLAITLISVYGFWLGFFKILEKTGVSDKISKLLSPLINFLFPGAGDQTKKFISMNMSANFLGLGNAATPMAINAVNSMDSGDKKASLNMIMLVVISSTSLQFIPSTVISMRIAAGSAAPTSFLIPCIIATIVSTFTGVFTVKIVGKILKSIGSRKSQTQKSIQKSVKKINKRTAGTEGGI